jgi:hypothetical protein
MSVVSGGPRDPGGLPDRRTDRFVGEIAGLGTASGHRFVIGRWVESPYGAFADVMHESPQGHRTLRAPSTTVADFVAATYRFDEVVVAPVVATRAGGALVVSTGDLHLRLTAGGRTAIGWCLRAVPRPVARSPLWSTLVDPIARVAMSGVRTRGTAGNGRREWYGATDQHRLDAVDAVLDGRDLGMLTDVWPPVRFGFSSTPRRPSVVSVTTTVRW